MLLKISSFGPEWFISALLVYFACSTLGCPGEEELSSVECPKLPVCRCDRYNSSYVLCCHLDSRDVSIYESLGCTGLSSSLITHLVIRDSVIEELNADHPIWTDITSISFVDSQVNRIVGSFRGDKISCVNVSSSSLSNISHNAFSNLSQLQILDLSGNNLTKLPQILPSALNISLDISGNSGIWCSSVKDVMAALKGKLRFLSYNDTFCLSSWSFHWFNSTEIVPLAQVEIVFRIENECPKGQNFVCTCSVARFDKPPGKSPRAAIRVECTDQNLSSLPPRLPTNTIFLNVSNNNISNLDLMKNESSYEDLRELYADNNQISSIRPLEGTKFIHSFDALSLKGNKFRSIDTYILSDAFDRNLHPRHVNLGGNRLNCDCNTAQIFRPWLEANNYRIPDHSEIICDNMEKVETLEPAKICVYQKDWTDYIYYIIVIEVFLLFLLISKVVYDYWVFKTAGYLPWPASKMPKLPCDWVFES